MRKRIHLSAAGLALLVAAIAWLTPAIAALFGSPGQISAVRQAILFGLPVLLTALIVVGATGTAIAGTSAGPRVGAKKRRMLFIAANGFLILPVTAFLLRGYAADGRLGTTFQVIQLIELAAGGVSIALMARNAGDGLRLSGRAKG